MDLIAGDVLQKMREDKQIQPRRRKRYIGTKGRPTKSEHLSRSVELRRPSNEINNSLIGSHSYANDYRSRSSCNVSSVDSDSVNELVQLNRKKNKFLSAFRNKARRLRAFSKIQLSRFVGRTNDVCPTNETFDALFDEAKRREEQLSTLQNIYFNPVVQNVSTLTKLLLYFLTRMLAPSSVIVLCRNKLIVGLEINMDGWRRRSTLVDFFYSGRQSKATRRRRIVILPFLPFTLYCSRNYAINYGL